MKLNKTIFLAIGIAILLAGCLKQKRRPYSQADLSKRIGWLHGDCLAIDNAGLPEGASLTMIKFGEKQSVAKAKVLRPAQSGDDCPALLEDRRETNAREGRAFYKISPPNGGELAIGILDLRNKIHRKKGHVSVDVNNDGHRDVFTRCSTSEGVSFNVWTHHAYEGKPLWSGYYYLGYDTEANCPR